MDRFNQLTLFLTRRNTLTALICVYAAVGFYVVATTDLSMTGLINLLDTQALAYGVGAGLAQIKFTKATKGEPILGAFAVVVFAVAIFGAWHVIDTSQTYEAYIQSMTPYVAALAIGKGLFAHNTHS